MTRSRPAKVVFVDPQGPIQGELSIERSYWEGLDIELVLADPPCRTEAEIVAAAHDADVVLFTGQYTPFNEEVFSRLENCLLVQRYGIGMDSLDPEAATRHGIITGNLALFCVQEVADQTAALIYGFNCQISLCDRALHAGEWGEVRQRMLPVRRMSKLILGIVGFGQIGQAVARRMRPAMGRIAAYDPYVDSDLAIDLDVELWELNDLMQAADIVTVHTPLMPSTRGLIARNELIKMKRTSFIVNTSRGGVIDEGDLIEALQEERIAGAALDVFAEEPMPVDHPFRAMDNVLLTPHTAGGSVHSFLEARHTVGQAVSNVLRGYLPPHVFNAGVVPRQDLKPAPAWTSPV